ncbi:hypothetical protein ACVIIV_003220 [Bradyrhizobium sp. USDA 4354]
MEFGPFGGTDGAENDAENEGEVDAALKTKSALEAPREQAAVADLAQAIRCTRTRFAPGVGLRRLTAMLRAEGHAAKSQARAAADAQDGGRGARVEAPHEQARAGHKIFPYLLRGLAIERPHPGLVRRHYLHSDSPTASLISWRSWTGRAGWCWRGYRTRWPCPSAWMRCRKPLPVLGDWRSSRPTSAASSRTWVARVSKGLAWR